MKRKTSKPASGQTPAPQNQGFAGNSGGPKSKQSPPANAKSKFRLESAAGKPSEKLWRDGEKPKKGAPATSGQVGPKSKPKVETDKQAAKETRRMDKTERRTDKAETEPGAIIDNPVKPNPQQSPEADNNEYSVAGDNETIEARSLDEQPRVSESPMQTPTITSGQVGPKSKFKVETDEQAAKETRHMDQSERRTDIAEAKMGAIVDKPITQNTRQSPEADNSERIADDNKIVEAQSLDEQPRVNEKPTQTPPSTSDQVGPKPQPKADLDKKAAKETRRMGKSEARTVKTGNKLEAARDKLAKQKPKKPPGAVKTITNAAGFEVYAKVHGKIHEVEHENVGVEAAHHVEIMGERAGRATVRFVKQRNRTRPARRVRKWEQKDIKANADFRFRQLAQENPELKSNAIKRHLQKKRIQKQFEKQAKEAAKKTAKKTGEATVSAIEKAGRAVVNFVKRHPVGVSIALLCFLLVMILQSCMGMMISVGNSMGGAVVGGTYPSEDVEMLAAETAYAGMEAALQYELDNYASLHPGYDEYHFDLDRIEHDPYVLISILSAWHEGAWTLADVQTTMALLFERQYILTETVTVEVRYYTVYWDYTDPETGETDSGSYEVPYNYYICNVTLENFNLSHLPIYIMGEERLSRYALYMATLGNCPDLFPVYLYPYASTYKDYGRHDIPQAYLDADPVFAAMIAEAERFLGYPYIWGGYNPNTSFDCSGFISWVLNNSGWSVGRLGAQSLYGICSPVSASNARPGDLIFFHSTYNVPGITHVGLYVGDGMMLHAGNPIGYAAINTAYWQSHFYAFGRP